MSVHLCFHGIGTCRSEREPGEARYWIGEHLFHQILDRLPGRPDVELSFDDGNRSDRDVALPALLERGLRASFFALAGRLDDPASLDAGDLVALREAGMVIGSHGWDHVPWRGLDARQAQREFVEARARLAQASRGAVDTAACPLGRYDRGTLTRLQGLDYRVVFTSDRFRARSGAWLQPRYSVMADDSLESVVAILDGRRPVGEARNFVVSGIKRIR